MGNAFFMQFYSATTIFVRFWRICRPNQIFDETNSKYAMSKRVASIWRQAIARQSILDSCAIEHFWDWNAVHYLIRLRFEYELWFGALKLHSWKMAQTASVIQCRQWNSFIASTNLNTGIGNAWLLQNNTIGSLTRRSIRMNLLSACKVGALLLMGSRVIWWNVTFQQVFAI